MDLSRGGVRLQGYPALVDEGRQRGAAHPGLPGCGTGGPPAGAAAADHAAARAECAASEEEPAGHPAHAAAVCAGRGGAPRARPLGKLELEDELVGLILDLTFVEDRPAVRDKEEFERRIDEGRVRLMEVADQACALVREILDRYQAVRKALAGITQVNWQPSVQDMRGQLDRLVFKGFLQQVGYVHLKDYPRYLQGLALRAEKLRHAAGRDQQRMGEMAAILEQWRERDERCRASGRADERVEELRWMLEELRVSLFAQELGTAFPASVKRIERWLRGVGL